MPYILQRWEEQESEASESEIHCTILGGAYIHGLMGGEAVQAVEKGVMHEQTFVLHYEKLGFVRVRNCHFSSTLHRLKMIYRFPFTSVENCLNSYSKLCIN